MFEQVKVGKIVIKFHMSYAVTEVLENGISYTNRSGIEHNKEYFTIEEANAVKEEIIESVKKAFDVKYAEQAYGGVMKIEKKRTRLPIGKFRTKAMTLNELVLKLIWVKLH